MFLGRFSSEVAGRLLLRPEPRAADLAHRAFSSPLGVYDFQKRSSILHVSEAGAQTLGEVAAELAYGEGLQAHARSAELRMKHRADERRPAQRLARPGILRGRPDRPGAHSRRLRST